MIETTIYAVLIGAAAAGTIAAEKRSLRLREQRASDEEAYRVRVQQNRAELRKALLHGSL